ncbi:MAG: formylglycine-generating enzyme family protein [Alphaproteobacteria bacterium]|nr:formylglycine-generating enzyme family protein [Alphaproteobacteria bacterium]
MRRTAPLLLSLCVFLAATAAGAQTPAAAPPAPAPLPAAGTVIRDCPECPEVVVVPAGIFMMGSPKGGKNERPVRPVRVPKPFAIGKYEVTFEQWDACRRAKACAADPDDHLWGRDRRPVMNVDFPSVGQYIVWLSRKTGRAYRLPSEAEWEYAARAGATTEFPWGDELIPGRANCRDCGSEWGEKGTAPVGSFPPNAWGLHDFNGNVWEWTQDCWNEDHEGAPKDTQARTSGDCVYRAVRGGSWYYFRRLARNSYRVKWLTQDRSYNVGFRVVREVP